MERLSCKWRFLFLYLVWRTTIRNRSWTICSVVRWKRMYWLWRNCRLNNRCWMRRGVDATLLWRLLFYISNCQISCFDEKTTAQDPVRPVRLLRHILDPGTNWLLFRFRSRCVYWNVGWRNQLEYRRFQWNHYRRRRWLWQL